MAITRGNRRFVVNVVDFELKFFTSCQVSLSTRLLGMTPPAPLSEAVTHYDPKRRMIPPWFRVKRLAWRSCKGKLLSQKAVGKPSAPLASKHFNFLEETYPKRMGFSVTEILLANKHVREFVRPALFLQSVRFGTCT